MPRRVITIVVAAAAPACARWHGADAGLVVDDAPNVGVVIGGETAVAVGDRSVRGTLGLGARVGVTSGPGPFAEIGMIPGIELGDATPWFIRAPVMLRLDPEGPKASVGWSGGVYLTRDDLQIGPALGSRVVAGLDGGLGVSFELGVVLRWVRSDTTGLKPPM